MRRCLVNTDIIIGAYELKQFHVLAASDSQGFDGSYMRLARFFSDVEGS